MSEIQTKHSAAPRSKLQRWGQIECTVEHTSQYPWYPSGTCGDCRALRRCHFVLAGEHICICCWTQAIIATYKARTKGSRDIFQRYKKYFRHRARGLNLLERNWMEWTHRNFKNLPYLCDEEVQEVPDSRNQSCKIFKPAAHETTSACFLPWKQNKQLFFCLANDACDPNSFSSESTDNVSMTVKLCFSSS